MKTESSIKSVLYVKFLNQEERNLIDKIEQAIASSNEKPYLDMLWSYDSKIGGIGAYSMPANPKMNPFKGGYTREVFRPLQYARSNIDILDIRFTARNVIRDTGMHLELLLKHVLNVNTLRPGVFYNKKTLGYLIKKAYNLKLIENQTYIILEDLLLFYNHSKHGINMDENKDGSFTTSDAISFYILSRKVASEILEPYYQEIYNDLRRIGILERFHINYSRKDDFDFVI